MAWRTQQQIKRDRAQAERDRMQQVQFDNGAWLDGGGCGGDCTPDCDGDGE